MTPSKLVGKALLGLTSSGAALFWLEIMMSREAVRLSVIGPEAIFVRHERVGTLVGVVTRFDEQVESASVHVVRDLFERSLNEERLRASAG